MTDYLSMTDEEFLKQMPPPGTAIENPPVTQESPTTTETPVVENPPANPEVTEPPKQEETTPEPKEPVVEPKVEPEAKPADGGTVVEPTKVTEPAKPDTQEPKTNPTKDAPKVDGQQETKPATGAVDYEAFYKQIMAPIKANGRTVELKDPAEVISLMQMGANYTRKMQDLAPHRKLLMMLQTNQIDEGKLSYLLDLDKKNPEAIRKLVKDAGINPIDIDVEAEPAYREGNHRVTDEEVAFHNHLDNLKSTDVGKETIRIIVNDWDQASKDALWKSPDVMEIINQQREVGIYDRIATEVNRQKLLGKIGPDTPFLQAYKAVGETLANAGAFADLVQKSAPQAAPVPIATRVEVPKPTTTNNEKAAAASATRTTPKTALPVVNPLAMSDEEFLKHHEQFIGRV